MLLSLEFALHALMDLGVWLGGTALDRPRPPRRVAAYRRGETVRLRCRYRMGARAADLRRGTVVLSGTGVVLDGASEEPVRLAGPVSAVSGGGRGGTSLTCTAVPAGGSGTPAELLLPTWDVELVRLVAGTVSGRR
ncbi:hypothetical protein [Streptomyces thermolilacinus]|uniref:Uncharacterized protein n=1 Tax=Streptomyces thermolilacinus SPC6 TaxID=1306406 RepID=A0A1D3DSP3_9ACTN|nr:hypothetical protein [Streptomyces thermolilacinus]OEJ95347.1 hypothetical protein J116_013555 [Streptomyces thermolilacinus SPC6]